MPHVRVEPLAELVNTGQVELAESQPLHPLAHPEEISTFSCDIAPQYLAARGRERF